MYCGLQEGNEVVHRLGDGLPKDPDHDPAHVLVPDAHVELSGFIRPGCGVPPAAGGAVTLAVTLGPFCFFSSASEPLGKSRNTTEPTITVAATRNFILRSQILTMNGEKREAAGRRPIYPAACCPDSGSPSGPGWRRLVLPLCIKVGPLEVVLLKVTVSTHLRSRYTLAMTAPVPCLALEPRAAKVPHLARIKATSTIKFLNAAINLTGCGDSGYRRPASSPSNVSPPVPEFIPGELQSIERTLEDGGYKSET
ncbi:hypothetical protein N1851_016640 [Merluccius polli]|uniref:Uncharacterized protein n=1 Tax=Merluccius polli TaxID=89951 RepID=A0AA47MQN0_MERPO|nr:hypothetical protein N1851_016640 [Merluccius polli]